MNVQSLAKHVQDLINDYKVLKDYVVGFTETQIKPSDSTCLINEVFKNKKVDFSVSKSTESYLFV